MRVKVVLEYDIPHLSYRAFKGELAMLTAGEQGLPGKCVYAAIEKLEVVHTNEATSPAHRA